MKYQPDNQRECLNILCKDCLLRESPHCLDIKLAEFSGFKVGD